MSQLMGRFMSQIKQGLLLLVDCWTGSAEDLEYAVRKLVSLRIFSDDEADEPICWNIQEEILSISQFTLFAITKKRQSSS